MHVRNYQKASILFISLSVFRFTLLAAAKFQGEREIHKKKAHKAQSKLQRSRRTKKNIMYEQTKIENEKQQRREQKKRGS